jgi:hypothetical protein
MIVRDWQMQVYHVRLAGWSDPEQLRHVPKQLVSNKQTVTGEI